MSMAARPKCACRWRRGCSTRTSTCRWRGASASAAPRLIPMARCRTSIARTMRLPRDELRRPPPCRAVPQSAARDCWGMTMRTRSWSWLLLLFIAPLALAAQVPSAPLASHRVFRIALDGASTQVVSGRLLLFALPAKQAAAQNKGGKVTVIDTNPFDPTQTAVAAMEVHALAPGASVLIDADALAFPEGFSKLAAGDYDVQAVLDVNHDYNYSGRGAGDLVSDVTEVPFNDDAAVPTLRLTHALAGAPQPWSVPEQV